MTEEHGGQPAGSYSDPEMVDTVRYWDGEKWTDRWAPAGQAAAPAAQAVDMAISAPHKPSRRPLILVAVAMASVLALVAIVVAARGGGTTKLRQIPS